MIIEDQGMDKPKGRIELIIGPMFSGKSTELLRRIKRHQCANKKCIVIKNVLDD
jgi:thymidine kinase